LVYELWQSSTKKILRFVAFVSKKAVQQFSRTPAGGDAKPEKKG